MKYFWSTACGSLLVMSQSIPPAAWACAVCWGGNEKQAWAFAVSGYVLLGTPFLILGSIIGGAYLVQRRLQRQRQGQDRPGIPSPTAQV